MDAKITAKVETITPEIAKTMLGENVNNRRISRDNVNLFAREIRNGEWRFNGEAIKFSKDGRLLDDQHRLLAASRAFRSQSGDMLTSSMFASLWWTFAHIDTDAANRFFTSLASGANLQADDPILILRNTLMAQPHKAGRSTRDNRVRIAALTIKAWNKWRKGKPLRQLKFSAGESFPTPQSTTTVHIKNNQKRNHHGIQQTLPRLPHIRKRDPIHRHHRDKERNPGFPRKHRRPYDRGIG